MKHFSDNADKFRGQTNQSRTGQKYTTSGNVTALAN